MEEVEAMEDFKAEQVVEGKDEKRVEENEVDGFETKKVTEEEVAR